MTTDEPNRPRARRGRLNPVAWTLLLAAGPVALCCGLTATHPYSQAIAGAAFGMWVLFIIVYPRIRS